jgi:hypothetical protein
MEHPVMTRILAAILLAALLAAGNPDIVAAARITPPDVIVVGGTPSGVVAAVAAARRGLTVELDVAGTTLGGVLTDGMMDQWDLNLGPSGEVIERGIFAEIVARLGDSFTPEHAEAQLAELVARTPRITVHFERVPQSVSTDLTPQGTTVKAILFRTNDGTHLSTAADYVDATDDGDVAALAGAHYTLGREDMGEDARMQSATLMFALRGVDARALAGGYDFARFGPGGSTGSRVWGFSKLLRSYRPTDPRVLVRDLNLGITPHGEVTVNAIDVLGVNGLDPAQVAAATALAKTEAPYLLAFLRDRVPGLEDAEIARFARSLYVRETRHVLGLAYLTSTDVWAAQRPFDTIGLSSYPLDLHPVTAHDQPGYAPVRHVYGVPFGALVPAGFQNLLLASRAISASHVAAGSARIIPTTIEEGEAAGAACALAQRLHATFPQIDRSEPLVADLRLDLRARGAILEGPSRLARAL